jgi:glycosyltransferase involved in cell wall biosynthesis
MNPKILVDLTYYVFFLKSSDDILKSCSSSLGYLSKMNSNFKMIFLARTPSDFEKLENNGLSFLFFKSKPSSKWQIPFRFNYFIKSLQPNYILAHGFGYAHYLIFLKIIIPKSKIVLQCNGYSPRPKGLKKIMYKLADKFIDGYLFTGIENAKDWYESKTLPKEKIFEVMEGSTHFRFDPNTKRDVASFLWVGRLDENKDPLTILTAFSQFLEIQPTAKLTMVFHEGLLEDQVRVFVLQNSGLKLAVNIIGYVEHGLLEVLYNKSQYFILGSHYEGSGYALVEAMACGCVPIITNIPSFKYMTNDGDCAFLFSPSKEEELLLQLEKTLKIDYYDYQKKVLKQFEDKLSFEAIANEMNAIFQLL